ncbi:MAG: cysteine desulfurase [Bacteroidales bacterium]|nr:cysteine desulfurase [Lentimicrobiaceae bacterium]MDD5695092.1 cysteine desulfurase [Bacteroidales bacterium]
MDVDQIRTDFPILGRSVYNKPLVYLDNAATTQKPQVVIDAVRDYYLTLNSNIHRGVHFLSQQATLSFEETRSLVREFIHARHLHEIIFTKGATESINLVASSFGKAFVGPGDEIVISAMEHHANILPWQLMCEERGAILRVIPLDPSGELLQEAYQGMLNKHTRLVAVTHVSNVLGTINPIKEMIRIAHQGNIPVLVDGAQAAPHLPVDVYELDCDFYCFSAHKMYGPMGVGILYGKEEWLEKLPPYQSGGEMISNVTFEKSSFSDLPYKFEAGTPNVADVLGFKATLTYLEQLGREQITEYETGLMAYALESLKTVPEIKLIGQSTHRAGVISFLTGDIHPYDVGSVLDKMGFAVRTGHHCAQPVMDIYGIPGTIRISLAFYNTRDEIDAFTEAVRKVILMFR